MSATGPSVLGRFAGELIVVALGVLLALAADRWNEDRTDRALAADYHARLLAELVADSIRVEEHQVRARERAAAGVELYTAVRDAVNDSTVVRAYYG